MQTLSVSNGIYNVILGSVVPIPITVPFNEQYWIGIQISPDAEMTPRQPLTSVPYALHSARADDVEFNYAGSSSKGGPAALALALNADGTDCPAGQYARGVDAAGNGQGCTSETDPQVGTLTNGKWCVSDGTMVNCNVNAPLTTEIDPTVNALGKAALSCSAGNIPKYVGGVWGCAMDAGDGTWLVSGSNMYSGVSGNVGIGTAAPTNKLNVSDTSYSNDDPAIYGEHAVADYHGIGVSGKGGWKGVEGKVAGTGENSYFGVNGRATSTGAGFTYGGHFSAFGGSDNYGGYFSASSGSNNYAIYALGDKNYFNGNVGIGTTTPSQKLHVIDSRASDDAPAIYGEHTVTDTFGVGVWGKGLNAGVVGEAKGAGTVLYRGVVGLGSTTSGDGMTVGGHFSAYGGANNYAIYAYGDKSYFSGNIGIGTEYPSQKLDVYGDYLTVYGNNNQAYFGGDNGGMEVEIGSLNAAVTKVAVFNHTTHQYMDTYVGTLHVMGGADFSEPFNLSDPKSALPGMLMAIDAERPGELRIADKPYDKTVAGIVSGANGVKPGLMMHQEGTAADGTTPIALSGRVYAWADASRDPIKPGDLLTTSATPGHAMKVTDYAKAQGSIVGKSMSTLAAGTGMILVLVSLQ